jgi:hypothetical protein
MTKFTHFTRTAFAATGALLVSIAFVSAAVAPAHVAGHAPAYAAAQSSVQANA